jgi:hypothetical protein
LDQPKAELELRKIDRTVKKWLKDNKDLIPQREKTFISRSTSCKNKLTDKYNFPHFYVTAKVHKSPLKTRPIVSTSGSILEGLGKWADRQLQPIGRATKAFIKSSADLLDKLKELPDLPPTAMLFTCDARSMHTNIDTNSTLETLRHLVLPHVLQALAIIMKNNTFRFLDTFWKQLNETAMGTPPSCMWATICFAAHEDKCTHDWRQYILNYARYIDDGFGIWNWTGTRQCIVAWQAFQAQFNDLEGLTWDFSSLDKTALFLDLRLYIRNGRVESTLYEKELSLYL